MDIRKTLLEHIEDYLAASGMSASAFGKGAVGDPSLVRRLRGGSSISLKTIEKIEGFMRSHSSAQAA